jgi:hypothetical protein
MSRNLRKLKNGTADLGLLTMPIGDSQTRVRAGDARRAGARDVANSCPDASRRRTAARSRTAGVRALRVRLELAHPDRGVLFAGASGAEDRQRKRERRGHQSAREKQHERDDRPVFQAVSREVHAGVLYATRIAGHRLFRESGWVHVRAHQLPRVVDEMKSALMSLRDALQDASAVDIGPMRATHATPVRRG